MATTIIEKLVCPKCGHVADAATPGSRCPRNDGYVLVEPAALARSGPGSAIGRVVAGRYPLIDTLGEGGMGTVYLGLQEAVGREVAIKIIRPESMSDPGVVGRFKREARIIAQLDHENVVTLYDHGLDPDGTMYLVMERLRGPTLGAVLRARRVLSAEAAVGVMRPVLAALSEAHELGLVHRDLKPDNIMLVPTRDGSERVKVLDFGVAKVVGAAMDEIRTRQNLALGTPQYMSPEQAVGADIGPASDLYAAGAILYEMLSGAVPFTGATPYAILFQHSNVAPRAFSPSLGVPAALETVVMRALAKAPTHRFESAAAMSAALRLAVGEVSSDRVGSTTVSAGAVQATPAPVPGEVELPVTLVSTLTELSGQRTTRPLELRRVPGRRWMLAFLAVAALVTTGVLLWETLGDAVPPAPQTVQVARPQVVPARLMPTAAPASAPASAQPAVPSAPTSESVVSAPPTIAPAAAAIANNTRPAAAAGRRPAVPRPAPSQTAPAAASVPPSKAAPSPASSGVVVKEF